MNTMVKAPGGRSRRRHSAQFKESMILACRQPGVSLASVALANGLNATMLHKWVTHSKRTALLAMPLLGDASAEAQAERQQAFIAVALPASAGSAGTAAANTHIEIEQAGLLVRIPASAFNECARGLRELLR